MTTTMLDPKLLGFWARCVREAQHLSQEALAEAAGITVRTVQRFEAGAGVQIGSRRSLAKALGYDDQDIFDDPKFAATVFGFIDDLKAFKQEQVDDQHPDQMRLPAQLVSCGEEAIRFAQGNDAALFDISADLNRETKEIAATFADYDLVGTLAAHAGLYQLSENAMHRFAIGNPQCVRHELFADFWIRMVDGESVRQQLYSWGCSSFGLVGCSCCR